MTSFSKNNTRVEIIITINVENCTNIIAQFLVVLYENCSTNCYYEITVKLVRNCPLNNEIITKFIGNQRSSDFNYHCNS